MKKFTLDSNRKQNRFCFFALPISHEIAIVAVGMVAAVDQGRYENPLRPQQNKTLLYL